MRTIEWIKDKGNTLKELRWIIREIFYRTQPDPEKKFILTSDVSKFAIGAVLSQVENSGNIKMVFTYSKALGKTQKN